MAKKSAYEAKFMSLHEAAVEFVASAQLITALQEGAVVAEGRYNPDITDDDLRGPREGEHQPIPAQEWLDCELNKAKTSLFHPHHHYAYTSIRIQKSALKALTGGGKQPTAGKGGRTVTYDWDRFWVEVATDLHNGRDGDRIATKWAKMYFENSAIWGPGRSPNEDDIRKKLGLLLRRLRADVGENCPLGD